MFGSKSVPADQKCKWCSKHIGQDGPRPIPLCAKCYRSACANNPTLWEQLCTQFEAELRALVKAAADRPTLTEAILDGNDVAKEVHTMQARVFDLIAQGKPEEAKALNLEVERRMAEVLRFRKEAPVHISQMESPGHE